MLRRVLPALLLFLVLAPPPLALAQDGVTRFLRYEVGGETSFGILEGETVRELSGDLFANPTPTGRTHPLASVRVLAPVEPSKVIAVGRNFVSHLGDRPFPQYPGLFAMFPTSIVGPGDDIVQPRDAGGLDYEGELVIVMGRRGKDIAPDEVYDHIFGVTAGNDVTERSWQDGDLQWFRGKASDTFAPMGPYIARGLNYDDLLLITRVNGEVVQNQRTSDFIFDIPTLVSYISRYVTLLPGDVIYTGTPQETRPMSPGDVVEVELEGVGVLRNQVVRAP